MKKTSLAEKLARKSFESAAIQQSWQVHLNAFGPMLRDSFPENYLAKTHLCAALNRISRRDGEGGRAKLAELTKHLELPMDHAAYHFFTALSFEAEGNMGDALTRYRQCCGYEPDFYMPWVKLAKLSQTAQDYDAAEKGWCKAVSLAPTPAHKAVFLTNLCGCLTCMKKLDEACTALMESRRLAPVQPGRDAVAAIYYAARGDAENAENCLSWVEKDNPALCRSTRAVVEKILSGEDPASASQG